MDTIGALTAPDALRRLPGASSDGDFQKWCLGVVDFLTPHHKIFTPFPRYFEVQTLNFLTLRYLVKPLLNEHYRSSLEIGCGVGLHSLLMSSIADQHLGVDIPGEYAGYTPPGYKSSAEISRALVNGVFGITNARFLDALADKLPAQDASVDLLYTWTVLEHIPDLPSAYREMVRVLRPGGLMIHVVPNTMSAIETIARVNVDAASAKPQPLGWLGALRQLLREYRTLAKTGAKQRGAVIPQCHSEFLTDYHKQLDLYLSDSYLFPLYRLGMQLKRLVLVRDFNHALVLRKPEL